jgi:hypothetical protein
VYAPSSNRQTSRPQGPVTLDAAGHTTAQAGFTYTWDGPGRLKTVRLSGTLLATYHYDHRGQRFRDPGCERCLQVCHRPAAITRG